MIDLGQLIGYDDWSASTRELLEIFCSCLEKNYDMDSEKKDNF